MKKADKINLINAALQKYFHQNPSVSKVMAKDLMPFFVREGIYEKDQKNGLPIRTILRDLDSSNQLHLIPSVLAERKDTNTNWFFIRPRSGSSAQIIEKKTIVKEKSIVSTSKADEHYIIDLCDEVLGQKASRQHRFDFLTGDTGTKLPVDAYYNSLELVVEFREKQHTEEVTFFDKPDRMTVSGVHRGEQRKLYDERRRKALPENGIKLIEISYDDFDYNNSKRIIRNHTNDIETLKNILIKEKILK